MRQEIKIRVIREPDEDQLYKFEISISNEECSALLAFYEYKDSFIDFGNKLSEFPQNLIDRVTYKLGEERGMSEKNWAYYLLIEAYCYGLAGESAIKIIINNNREAPRHQRSEFYIISEAAFLNILGNGLKSWDPEFEKEFEWISSPSAT